LKRTTLMVAGIAMAAALVVGGTTASAATHHTAKVAPAKVTQLQKLSRLDGQFISLTKRVRPCTGSAAQIRAAGAMRRTALKRARQSSVRVLKTKNVKMSKAVLRLAKFAGQCGKPGGTAPVILRPDSPGGTSAGLTLPELLGSQRLDTASLLDGGILPDTINAVPLDQLLNSPCVTQGTACVGIDLDALAASLTRIVNDNPLVAPLVTPLLNQVLAALRANDLDSLLSVKRVNDTVVQIVPEGPLATLQALLGSVTGGSASGLIGRLQVS
jgi:hypothetical protein